MRTQEICHHIEQSNKIRARLEDSVKPPDVIKKPKGMRTLRFEASIKRLKRHEEAICQKLINGLTGHADSLLRSEVNRKYEFDANRPIYDLSAGRRITVVS